MTVVIKDIESDADVAHFFGDGIAQQSVAIGFVEGIGFSHSARDFNAIFMCAFQATRFNLGDDVILLFDYVGYPPSEELLVLYASSDGVFCNFDGVVSFEFFQRYPRFFTVAPFNVEIPAFGSSSA